MKTRDQWVLLILTMICLPATIFASSLCTDAEYLGRGDAGVAGGGEKVSSIYYNPAALAMLSEPQIEMGINSLASNSVQSLLAMAYPFSRFRMALAGNQIVLSQRSPDSTNISLALAGRLDKLFGNNFGLRLDYQEKSDRRDIDGDLGIQFPGLGVDWGLVAEQIFHSDINGYSGIILGGVKSFGHWKILLDTEYSRNKIWARPALEYSYYQGLGAVRLGYFADEESPNITLGMSGNIWPVKMDFSLVYRSIPDNYTMSESVAFRFGPGFDWYYLNKATDKFMALNREISNLEKQKKSIEDDIQRLQQVYDESKWLAKKSTGSVSPSQILETEKVEKKVREKPEAGSRAEVSPAKTISGPRKHLVKSGDTLRALAQKYYGNPNRWQEIYQANPDKIERGTPRVGAELTIP